MKKAIFYLLPLLLITSGCLRNKKGKVSNQDILTTSAEVVNDSECSGNKEAQPDDLQSYDYISQEEKNAYDDSVDAFVLDKEDLLFNEENTQTDDANQEDLHLEDPKDNKGDISLGDTYNDSAIHGFRTIYYDFGKSGVKANQSEALNEDISLVKDLTNKGYVVVLEGHACNSAGSSDARNITISEERPQIIADELVIEGVNPESIKVVGRGAEMKIVPHGDRIQQTPNRRVEFYAYKD